MAKQKSTINPDEILAEFESSLRTVPVVTRTEEGFFSDTTVVGKDPADVEANQQIWNQMGNEGESPTYAKQMRGIEVRQDQASIDARDVAEKIYTGNDAADAVLRTTLQAGSALPRMMEWATGQAGEEGSLTRNISHAIGPAYDATDPGAIADVTSTVAGTIGEFITGGGSFGKMVNYGLNTEKIAVGASKMRQALQNPASGFASGAFMQTMPQLEVEAADVGLTGIDKFNYVASQGMIEAIMTRLGGMSGLERVFDKKKFATNVSKSFLGRLKDSGLMLVKEGLKESVLEEMPIFVLQSVNSYVQGIDRHALDEDQFTQGLWETFWVSMLAAGAVNAPRAVMDLAKSDSPNDIIEAAHTVELGNLIDSSMGKKEIDKFIESIEKDPDVSDADPEMFLKPEPQPIQPQQAASIERTERAQEMAKEVVDVEVKRGAAKRLAPLIEGIKKNLPQGTTVEIDEDTGIYTATTTAGYKIQYVMPEAIPVTDREGYAQSIVADHAGKTIGGVVIPKTVDAFQQLSEVDKQRVMQSTQPKGAATLGQNVRVTMPSGEKVTLDGDVIIQLRDGKADLETIREEQHHATLQMMEMIDAPLNKKERRALRTAARAAGYNGDVEGIYRVYRQWRDKPGKRGALKQITDKIYDFFSKIAELAGFDPFTGTVFRRTERGEQLARKGERVPLAKEQAFATEKSTDLSSDRKFYTKQREREASSIEFENDDEKDAWIDDHVVKDLIGEALEIRGFYFSGSSNISESQYYSKDIPIEIDEDGDVLDQETVEIRISDHKDVHGERYRETIIYDVVPNIDEDIFKAVDEVISIVVNQIDTDFDIQTAYSVADNTDRSQEDPVPAWQGTLVPFPQPAKEIEDGGKIYVPMADPKAPVTKGRLMGWLRKYMSTAGNLPKDVARRKISAEGELSQVMNDVGAVTKNYRQAVRTEFPKGVKQADIENMNAFLKGEDFAGELSPKMQEALNMMRFQIDALSTQMVQHGIVDGDLAAAIDDNMGVYLRRSYQIFDDPDWAKKVSPDVKNRAISWIREQRTVQKEPHEIMEMSDSELESMIGKYDVEIEEGASREAMIDALVMHEPNEVDIEGELERLLLRGEEETSFGSMSSRLGKKDLSMLKKRKDIPKELRELWGEYTDPLVNYAKSVGGMANAIVNQRFLNDVVRNGEGVYLFKKPQPGFAKIISAEGNEAMKPLDGMYTSTEIHEALSDYYTPSSLGYLARRYMMINGYVKYAKTVLSHATQMRNLFGNFMFAVANADLNPIHFGSSFKALMANYLKKPESEWRQYYKKMLNLGVIGESVHGGEIRDVIKDAAGKDIDDYLDSTMRRAIRAPAKLAQAAYEAGDDLWKMFAFENERTKLIKAYPDRPVNELELEAAEIIRNTYPTYSNIPAGIRYIRRVPFFGTFVSFPAEVTRVTYNTILQIGKELKSGNAVRRRQGFGRLMGMATAMTLSDIAWHASMALFGIDDEEDEAFRHTGMPEWSQNSAVIYLNDDKTDRMWMDLGQFDPYAVVKKPIRAAVLSLLRGDDAQETTFNFIGEAMSPYASEDILFQKLLDVKRNQTQNGVSIYNEEADLLSQWADIGKHVGQALTPGSFDSARRMWLAQTGQIIGKRKYDPTAEAIAQFGTRVQSTNLPRNFTYAMRDYNRSRANSKRILSDTARSLGEVTDDQIRSAYDNSDKASRRAFADAIKHVNDMRLFGYSDGQITALLMTGGISGDNVGAMLNGIYDPFVPPESYFQNLLVQSAVSDVPMDEAADTFAQRLVVMTEASIDHGADAGPRLEYYRTLGKEIAWDSMRKIDEKQILAVGGHPRDINRAVMATKRVDLRATINLEKSRKLLRDIEDPPNEGIKRARTRTLLNTLKRHKKR